MGTSTFDTLGVIGLLLTKAVTAEMRPTAVILADELKERGLSIRGLARVLAGNDEPKDIEMWRRALYRYLKGSEPEEKQAAIMESRLGLPEGTFPRFDRKRPLSDGSTFGERLSRIESHQGELSATLADAVRALELLEAQVEAVEHGLALARREFGG